MIAQNERQQHEQTWLLLPWLANGRLAGAERTQAEDHVQQCRPCQQELELQERMCHAFGAPDRVIYAAGPSFRKLMDRINNDVGGAGDSEVPEATAPSKVTSLVTKLSHVSLWRPPGLAWAASFLLLFGITGMMFTTYRWLMQPDFRTHTNETVVTPGVLRIALDRSLSIGEAQRLLRKEGARAVEYPVGAGVLSGLLSVTPLNVVPGKTEAAVANKQLRSLAARLRANPRVLWVEPLTDDETVQPLTDDETSAAQQVPGAADHRARDVQEH